jgi:HSP20 family molecular chaperone IbpA
MKKLAEIVAAVTDYPVKRVAVAAAADRTVIEAVKMATERKVATVVDTAKITAECNNGVLTVKLPKSEKAKPTKIEIKG